MLRVVDIVDGTSVDGPGLRTSIYFAGCDHRCPGCHNPSTWDFNAGKDMTVDELMLRIIDNEFNVTFSGGDPLYQLEPLTALARAVKAAGKTIWCYTGFIYEDLLADPRYAEILSLIDVLVDGPFILALRDTDLRFRGSSNQRIIPLHP
ncbi:MAG: anaerobic ribonucleoside-triphosphate reductase activating protein [Muribaculaceae bacterium]|nr:anaerobic ribonucleoside-triphosphate reductase activating protein [Muribaculaceae bacterium]